MRQSAAGATGLFFVSGIILNATVTCEPSGSRDMRSLPIGIDHSFTMCELQPDNAVCRDTRMDNR